MLLGRCRRRLLVPAAGPVASWTAGENMAAGRCGKEESWAGRVAFSRIRESRGWKYQAMVLRTMTMDDNLNVQGDGRLISWMAGKLRPAGV